MQTYNDIHQQFASFFKSESLKPFAYLVSKKLAEGHICLNLDEPDFAEEEMPAHYLDFKTALKELPKNTLVTQHPTEKQPFVLFQNRLYLQRYFHYETSILIRIGEFISSEKANEAKRISALEENRDFISSLFESQAGIVNWQLAAAISSYINNFSIITGGPGTGKTTTVAKILAILFHLNSNLKVALAAPTGKASARMAESLKSTQANIPSEIKERFEEIQPATLHRLLGYIQDSPYFKHNRENPLNYDVIIVDESSMIDVALFSKLLDAVGEGTRLILLGDRNQLASVEAGSLFGDLCVAQSQLNVFSAERLTFINSFIPNPDSKIDTPVSSSTHPLFQHVVELMHSHRFNSEEGIGKFSTAIISNAVPHITDFIEQNHDKQVHVDMDFSPSIFKEFVSGYRDYILEPDKKLALQKINQLRVLCAIREGDQGLYTINKRIEQTLVDQGLLVLDREFYENRPIIMNSNNYELGLFNGDIGIARVDDNGDIRVFFEDSEGNLKSILPGFLANVETVFAMTIHKSQGSEFNEVLVVLPQAGGSSILTRELLYTGITRAKNKVILQASKDVIVATADAQVKRASGISNRFLEVN